VSALVRAGMEAVGQPWREATLLSLKKNNHQAAWCLFRLVGGVSVGRL